MEIVHTHELFFANDQVEDVKQCISRALNARLADDHDTVRYHLRNAKDIAKSLTEQLDMLAHRGMIDDLSGFYGAPGVGKSATVEDHAAAWRERVANCSDPEQHFDSECPTCGQTHNCKP